MPWCKGWFGKKSPIVKRIILTILGQGIGIVTVVYDGGVWYMAIVNGLLIQGGAIALYEQIKPLMGKSKTQQEKKLQF